MLPDPDAETIQFRVTESRRTPALSVFLGSIAMVPFAVGAVAAWVLGPDWSALAAKFTLLWGCSILIFLAGVRRGVSFRTAGGPTVAQIATMVWLFVLGVTALMLPGFVVPLVLLLAGYLSLAVLDPLAARRGEAPLFFERLRPVQMLVPLASLAAVLVRALVG